MKRVFTTLALCTSSLFANSPPAGAVLPIQDITPCAGPRVLGGWDMFITADFIYWTTRVDSLGSVLSGFTPTTPSVQGKVYNPHWKWEPGFKVGIGSNLAKDGWDTLLNFTWFQSNARAKTDAANLMPLWNIAGQYDTPKSLAQEDGEAVYASDADWAFWMNWFDLELGRNCFLSPHLKLRPFIGLKTAFGIQKYEVQYTRQVNFNVQARDTMNNNFHYCGVGPRTGLNSAWQFSEAWSLYGNFAASLLWSQFLGQRRDEARTIPASENDGVVTLNIKNHLNTCKPVLEFELGFRWEIWFSDDDYHFMLHAGWEEQIWFDYNQVIRFNEAGAAGNLTTQGLTTGFRFDF